MDTLGHLYETDVDYFARINFTGFATLIDAIGGITVYADIDDDLVFAEKAFIEKSRSADGAYDYIGFFAKLAQVFGL